MVKGSIADPQSLGLTWKKLGLNFSRNLFSKAVCLSNSWLKKIAAFLYQLPWKLILMCHMDNSGWFHFICAMPVFNVENGVTACIIGLIWTYSVQVKAYTTRVGSGPFPTEILGKGGDMLRFAGQEFGTTTGRPRRCGWLDIVALKYCCQINGFSSLNLTKLDVLSELPEIQLGVAYKQHDGTPIKSFPADLRLLDQLKVRHLTCPVNFYVI